MVSATLKNYLLLENKECPHHVSISYDENYFYICLQNKCNIFKLDLNGRIVDTIKTNCPYKSLCFDNKDNCFWSIKDNCPRYIYKSNHTFEEIDSFILKDFPYDCICNIAYKASDDTLLLSSLNCIYNVSKQGELLFKHKFNNNHLILSSGEVGGNFIKCTNYITESIVVINMIYHGYCEEILNCVPSEYRPISIFPARYDINNNEFYIVTVKNKQFIYLLKYELVNIYENKTYSERRIRNAKHCIFDDFVCVNDINIF